MNTKRLRLDRIASAARNAGLAWEITVGDELVAREGHVVAVRILNNKYTYNTVEDVTGRMLPLRQGDLLAGVLGSRRALRGYAGVVPSQIRVGDVLHVLNLGGVLGTCTAANPELGPPFAADQPGRADHRHPQRRITHPRSSHASKRSITTPARPSMS